MYDSTASQQWAYYKIIPKLRLYTCVSSTSYFIKALLAMSTGETDAALSVTVPFYGKNILTVLVVYQVTEGDRDPVSLTQKFSQSHTCTVSCQKAILL